MLDADLAALYHVPTRVLVQAVKRNLARFPGDFMFQLRGEEARRLRSRIVISNVGRGGRRYPPYAFTEQGVGMLSSVLRSPRAIRVNIEIMRAFVRLRGLLASNQVLAKKVDALEKKYDSQFKVVFDAIRRLMASPITGRHPGRARESKVTIKDVVEVRPLGGHRLYLKFDDGVHGEVDVAQFVRFDGMFEELRDPRALRRSPRGSRPRDHLLAERSRPRARHALRKNHRPVTPGLTPTPALPAPPPAVAAA